MSHTRFTSMATMVFLLTIGSFQHAQAQSGGPQVQSSVTRAPYHFSSISQARINGQKLSYIALVEETFVTNLAGEKTASLVSTSYMRSTGKKTTNRPVVFVFNGGPGSAGLWLQMGLVGPRRVDFKDDVNPPTGPPYHLTDNAESILDVADVVIFDPPGTGFSRILPAGDPGDFYGVTQDAKVTLDFVSDWIKRNNRFNSPRFLVGESYGAVRAAVVAKLMAGGPFGSGSMEAITLNGVIILGQALDGQSGEASFANSLPSLAATAWYHAKVDQKAKTLQEHVAAAQQFASSDYIQALYAGSRLTSAERQSIAERISGMIGLPIEQVLAQDLRVTTDSFASTLLSDTGMQVGKYDSRFVLPLAANGNDPVADDPAMGQYVPGFVAALNLHMIEDLGVNIEESYLPIEFHQVNGRWDYGRGPGAGLSSTNRAEELAVAMRRNPSLQLFIGTGYYDLVTTVGAAEYMVAHTDFPADRVVMKNYASGHMPYLGEVTRKQLSEDLRQFIVAATSP